MNSNWSSFKAFVNISANWCFVSMNSRTTSLLRTWSRMKWCLTSMCLVLECWIGFLVRHMALVLSHFMGIFSRWNTLEDYGIHFKNIPIKCDNTSAICLTKNPIQHSRTKHIDIRHHFIRDHVTNHDVIIEFIDTKHQLADIFTKPLSEEQFDFIRRELGMLMCPNA